MPPIGETLREARLRQRIEIAEVEQATKIRAKYLRALESEEFERLPGSTFVRTFLRTYAEYLGLDSQALVEEYRVRHELPEEEELQPFQPQPSAPPLGGEGRRRPVPQAPGRGPVIAGAVIAILALLLVIGLVGGDDDGGRRTGAAERRDQGGREQGGGEPKKERTETQPADDTVELEVEPAAETYVCVENGEGEQLINATILEPETFSGKTLRVLFGNTLAVQLAANGENVAIEESPNPVAREFTPEGDEEISTTALSC
jgi:cytoskeleton protein RodZ